MIFLIVEAGARRIGLPKLCLVVDSPESRTIINLLINPWNPWAYFFVYNRY
jgi:hypothetical protein